MTTKWRTLNRNLSVSAMLLVAAVCSSGISVAGESNVSVDQPVDVERYVIDSKIPNKRAVMKKFRGAEREQFPHGIAHYKFEVRVGPREFDVVRIHRVVAERKPHRPVRTRGAVFLTHGAQLNFESIYLRAGAENPDTDTSVALNLAGNGIDVWGMDFGWARVPIETTDFEFMQDWGVERDADHTLKAMAIARLLRGLTGQGFGRINLLGYSYSVAVIYAAAGRESQQPRYWRDIRGLIPVDGAMKYSGPNEASRLDVCTDAASVQTLLDDGIYQDTGGQTAGLLSALAISAPDDPSPVIPGLTNYQTSLFFAANSYLLFIPRTPFWHFMGGEFDDFGLPSGLRYADEDRWNRFLGNLSPYMPNLARYESGAVICDEDELGIDDFLTQISVPILYIGAAGAFGDYGDFTSTLTASRDVTNFTVSLQSESNRAIDYGHADLFLADDAEFQAWNVLRDWIIAHR